MGYMWNGLSRDSAAFTPRDCNGVKCLSDFDIYGAFVNCLLHVGCVYETVF